jgi:hypothetical protein
MKIVNWEQGFFVHHRTVSAVKRVEFVSDRVSYDRGYNDVRRTEIHTAKPLVPEPSVSQVEVATEKVKSHKSTGIDQIPTELIKPGDRTICCEIHRIIISVWNKEELPEEW